MKKLAFIAFAFMGLLALSTGCVYNNYYKDTQKSPSKACPKTECPKTECTKKACPKMEVREVTLQQENCHDLFLLGLDLGGTTPEEKSLVDRVGNGIAGATLRSVRITEVSGSDMVLSLQTTLKTLDQDSDYYRMKCTIVAKLHAPNTVNEVYAMKTFDYEAPKRVLGLDRATMQFCDPAIKDIVDWCNSELARIEREDIGITCITFALPDSTPENAELDNAYYVGEISKILDETPDVFSYSMLNLDTGCKTCDFRIVYRPATYPAGLKNDLVIRLQSIPRK